MSRFFGFPTTPKGIPGRVLGHCYYNPATSVNYTVTASYANLDATNIKVSFVAPVSGIVWAEISILGKLSSSSPTVLYAFHDGVSIVSGSELEVFRFAATIQVRPFYLARISGLNRGYPYTWTVQAKNVATGTCFLGWGQTTNEGPAVIRITEE